MGQVTLADVHELRRYRRDGRAAGDPQQNAAESQHAAQADDEGGYAQISRHVAIGKADQQPAKRDQAQVRQQWDVVNHIQNGGQPTEQSQ
ncbi:hypothetical protein D3C73_1434470 [compost metagenome]